MVAQYLFVGSPKLLRVRKTGVVLLVGRTALLEARLKKITVACTSEVFLLHGILRVRVNLHRQH